MRYITVETEVINRLLRANKDLAKRLETLVDRLERLTEVNRTLPKPDELAWVDDKYMKEVLGFSVYQLKKIRNEGVLPFRCVGGKYFYQCDKAFEVMKLKNRKQE